MMMKKKREGRAMLTSNVLYGTSHFASSLKACATRLTVDFGKSVEMVSCAISFHSFVFYQQIMKSSMYFNSI